MVPCVNADGKPDHVLLMKVETSPLLHVNQADEAFVRVGDKTKKLSFQDRLTLMYAKGLQRFAMFKENIRSAFTDTDQ